MHQRLAAGKRSTDPADYPATQAAGALYSVHAEPLRALRLFVATEGFP